MTEQTKQLKLQADKAKASYNLGHITREECKKEVMPYINHFNARSKELAKKYNQRAKTISFITYIR